MVQSKVSIHALVALLWNPAACQKYSPGVDMASCELLQGACSCVQPLLDPGIGPKVPNCGGRGCALGVWQDTVNSISLPVVEIAGRRRARNTGPATVCLWQLQGVLVSLHIPCVVEPCWQAVLVVPSV
jgi:hypothetical protein